MAPSGAEGFFPTDPDAAEILGRTDFDSGDSQLYIFDFQTLCSLDNLMPLGAPSDLSGIYWVGCMRHELDTATCISLMSNTYGPPLVQPVTVLFPYPPIRSGAHEHAQWIET